MLPQDEIAQFATELYQRRGEAVMLDFAAVTMEGWAPQQNRCHENVTIWCINNEGYEIVRGWLYFDFGGALPIVRFVAHSAVRASDGKLYDITPQLAVNQYPFIPDNRSEDEYAEWVQGRGLGSIDFQPS